MGNHSKEAHDRAEAIFKRQDQQRARITAEHEAESDAVREKTARLKSLRLAKLEAERKADVHAADMAIPIDQLNASNDE